MAIDAPRKAEPPDPAILLIVKLYFFLFLLMMAASFGLGLLGDFRLLKILPGLLVLLVLSGIYIVLPVIVGRKVRMPSDPEIQVIDLDSEQWPHGLDEKLRATIEPLQRLGFDGRGVYFFEKSDNQNDAYLAILENRSEQTVARWFAMVTPGKSPEPTLSYTTRFGDGTEIITGNTSTPSVVPIRKTRKGFAFPGLDDPERLLKLHRRALSESGEFSMRVNQIEGDPLTYLRNSLSEEMGVLVKSGYYRLDEKTGQYRLTLIGTFLGTWKQFWPWGRLRKARLQIRAARRLREWAEATT